MNLQYIEARDVKRGDVILTGSTAAPGIVFKDTIEDVVEYDEQVHLYFDRHHSLPYGMQEVVTVIRSS